ncbi:hypothetical protein [Streptomyces sp. DH37]|uniref:hypothetical protein n=1 Tax=Streptomyces sp. DH37 TaxID=3040122 RepID=UPI0024429C94|nr:hypothetical protein [Streptomyces sp. DH37]MDG9703766.1 hypothetical protein [Streptomyces sp. DH37]
MTGQWQGAATECGPCWTYRRALRDLRAKHAAARAGRSAITAQTRRVLVLWLEHARTHQPTHNPGGRHG